MSPRARRVLAALGFFTIAAGLGAAALQDDGRTWKVHAKDRPQPEMVEPGRAGTAARPGTAPSDAIVLLSEGSGLDAWSNGKWTFADGVMGVKPGTGDTFIPASRA